mmetsp:Transcript_38888/g.54765  ORF Transcript_38888/g.54765 Transcript_38888/m.54765 type:complete len:273 (+) Transcript_38888:135-953(+)|eukprot:CAMPEP_0202479614 /NCGR_PEP_ID=MMETSP1360-20130828/95076_1 /ASSEMBLY_ACC=CAM_ASM_000848 /TAXON_ID=515479 /ORGANISM="Licmophora paradoxa, Strain CCMP2313" /LENGTH=272 /DNA_ID=CAMNT_0049106949 /DNA_START=126 /DNA_END=944 /DNA_ORIENTATION=-
MNAKSMIASSLVTSALAFQAASTTKKTAFQSTASGIIIDDQGRIIAPSSSEPALYDPFNLYPKNSPERIGGRIHALEPEILPIKPVLDPFGLYSNSQGKEVDNDAVLSKALPFMAQPLHLTKELAGDAGFDPLCLATDPSRLLFMREAELKHSRIAMLATAGWAVAELYGSESLLVAEGKVPSLLNGGLASVSPLFWSVVLGMAFGIEYGAMNNEPVTFDPLRISQTDAEGRMQLQNIEISHGRWAMLAITGFAMQEWATGVAVIHQTPFFL